MHKIDWRSWCASRKPATRFVAKFGMLIILFYGLLAIPFCDRLLYKNLEANAWLAGGILNAFGQHTSVLATTIRSPQFAMMVHRGCDGVEPTLLFCAALLAARSSPRSKIFGIICGAILLHLLNLVRIVTLFWFGIHAPKAFHLMHLEIWPTLFILAELGLFLGWMRFSSPKIP